MIVWKFSRQAGIFPGYSGGRLSLPACRVRCSLIKIVKYTELLKYMVFVGPFYPSPQLSQSKVATHKNLTQRPFAGFPSVIILRNTV